MAEQKKHGSASERFIEWGFEKIGRVVGLHPCKTLVATVLFAGLLCSGARLIVNESRPERQWVARGALALEHNEYNGDTWPSNSRFNFFTLTCADVEDPEKCNVMEPKYLKAFHEINKRIMDITIDGDELVKRLDKAHKRDSNTKQPWHRYKGNWTFMGEAVAAEGDDSGVTFKGRKCFTFGPFCARQSVLDVFRNDDNTIGALDMDAVKRAVNAWEDQETMCPLSLAAADSPCHNVNCQKYKTTSERLACRQVATDYCRTACPTRTVTNSDGEEVTIPVDMDTCMDSGCITMGSLGEDQCPLSKVAANSPCSNYACSNFESQTEKEWCKDASASYCSSSGTGSCPTTESQNGQGATVFVAQDSNSCGDDGCVTVANEAMRDDDPAMAGDAPESAFEFEPFKIKTAMGPLKKSSDAITGARYLSGYFAVNKEELYCPAESNVDPVAEEWERRVLCEFGIDADTRHQDKLKCKKSELLSFTGFFQRSFGDEFGTAIRGDIGKLSASYFIIILYCGFMIGKRDPVHSGITLAMTAVLIVGLTIGSTMGLMGYLGVPNTQLNNNLYFLILGLGVDDAFVLSSEFTRHTMMNPELSIAERIAKTARTGGMSVLITSATDALAFLVGATTVLPALGWFCTWAGTAILFCFLYQLIVFLPVLALNARRAEKGLRDCCCCPLPPCTLEPRPIGEPKGCCLCCNCGDDLLRRVLKGFGEKITTRPLQIAILVVFVVLAGFGIGGSCMLYKDFKLEWFIPDDSYVNQWFQINNEHFASGPKISVNFRNDQEEHEDFFVAQAKLHEAYGYLTKSKLVNQDVDVDSWYENFMEWAVEPTASQQDPRFGAEFEPSADDFHQASFKSRAKFYESLHYFYRSSTGARERGNLRWMDTSCEVDGTTDNVPAGCDIMKGLNATRMSAELTLASTNTGQNRYATMTTMRQDLDKIYPGSFPYSFDFLYWEEVGVIDTELVRNLLICGAVVFGIVFVLVPVPRISIWVLLCVTLSIVDVLGFMHFWGVTISGVSSIYVLICVGLAVDYAAHIAHMFKETCGTSRERAIAALERIGPCTFNAVFSTFLAVVVVGFSNSYIFRVFFKVLFLVTVLAGGHGMVLLPVLLSLFGGDRELEVSKPGDAIPSPNEKQMGA